MLITKCFDINVIKMPSKKMYIYRFKCFSYLYIRTIGGSVDYNIIFFVILANGNMHIFKTQIYICLFH